MDGRRLSISDIVIIALQICLALEHAHKNKIIHRDLKPQNIIVNSQKLVKVTDFGLAKAASQSIATLSQDSKSIGTPYYISPEQINGDRGDSAIRYLFFWNYFVSNDHWKSTI